MSLYVVDTNRSFTKYLRAYKKREIIKLQDGDVIFQIRLRESTLLNVEILCKHGFMTIAYGEFMLKTTQLIL